MRHVSRSKTFNLVHGEEWTVVICSGMGAEKKGGGVWLGESENSLIHERVWDLGLIIEMKWRECPYDLRDFGRTLWGQKWKWWERHSREWEEGELAFGGCCFLCYSLPPWCLMKLLIQLHTNFLKLNLRKVCFWYNYNNFSIWCIWHSWWFKKLW